jgi:para-nitrobenzyl esterase
MLRGMTRSLVLCACIFAAGCDGAVSEGVEIATLEGPVRGYEELGARHFLAIPYAAPPVGELRFRAPRPAAARTGLLDATRRGPACAQVSPVTRAPDPMAKEDCLTVNIWSPSRVKAPLPVMVWLHGGGFILGSGNENTYDGANLARRDVVVVTVNYRLGPFGFMAHEAFEAEDPARRQHRALWRRPEQRDALRRVGRGDLHVPAPGVARERWAVPLWDSLP